MAVPVEPRDLRSHWSSGPGACRLPDLGSSARSNSWATSPDPTLYMLMGSCLVSIPKEHRKNNINTYQLICEAPGKWSSRFKLHRSFTVVPQRKRSSTSPFHVYTALCDCGTHTSEAWVYPAEFNCVCKLRMTLLTFLIVNLKGCSVIVSIKLIKLFLKFTEHMLSAY